jgi:hypothetical protein
MLPSRLLEYIPIESVFKAIAIVPMVGMPMNLKRKVLTFWEQKWKEPIDGESEP